MNSFGGDTFKAASPVAFEAMSAQLGIKVPRVEFWTLLCFTS